MDAIYRKILCYLETHYPGEVPAYQIYQALHDIDKDELGREIHHLKEVGLVDAAIHVSTDGRHRITLAKARISAKGRDWLKPDGGLSADINTVIVKLHAQTIKDLINSKIELSDVDSSTKGRLKEAVRNLPAHTLEEVVTHFVQKGLDHGQDAIQWLQRLIQ